MSSETRRAQRRRDARYLGHKGKVRAVEMRLSALRREYEHTRSEDTLGMIGQLEKQLERLKVQP